MGMLEVPDRRYLGTRATAPGPTGPQMLPAFGAIRRDPLAYLAHTWRTHGDIVQFPIPRPPSYLVCHPDAVRRVLVERPRAYSKETIQYRALSLVTGAGLLTAEDPPWRQHRLMLQPAFHPRQLEPLVGEVELGAARLVDRWQRLAPGAVVDVERAMLRAGLETVGHALFTEDLSGDAAQLTDATLAALEVVVARARVPVTPPAWVPTPGNRRLQRANAVLDRTVARLLRARRAQAASSQPDVLDLLIAARDDRGQGLTDREIRDEIVTFIVAGHETVAAAMTWCWALLAAHPEVQARLQQEVDTVVTDAPLGLQDLARLPYARACVDEALRLYPPAWLISRKALTDDRLSGAEIPAGALIIMSPWIVHRHPQFWTDAERFDPQRFVEGGTARHAFMPFGNGLRLCIGRDFAYAEAVALIARIASRFTVSYPAGARIPAADPSVTMRPVGGLHLVVQPRHEPGLSLRA
ncbi:MAG: cytochrome P450 [Candidatus Nanopelagicales bacterium]|nr:cytochrome P450 [Candidatus Nanopelagicales bacterium]